jgi:outer membrane protein OmpA-like peptidoglycan-associated protein
MNREFKNPLPGATVKLFNRCTGELQETKADQNGKYKFWLGAECAFAVVGTKENFRDNAVSFTTVGKGCAAGTINIDIPLDIDTKLATLLNLSTPMREGMVIELENIYYDFDKYYIRKDAEEDLEAVYQLMVNNPEMKGEIGAHTDSRASHKYNDKLSENRAKAAVEWLVKRGVSRDRLTYKGYGETKLKNQCADGVDCTPTEHQRNRRVEFKVTYLGNTLESKERPEYQSETTNKP